MSTRTLNIESGTRTSVVRRAGLAAWVFVLVATVAGTLFVFVNPPFWGNDGLSQYARAYQVSQGGLLPQQIEWYGKGDSYGGSIPASVWSLYEHAAKDLGANESEPAAMILEPAVYDALGHERYRSANENLIWFSNTAAYSPVPYAPAALASLIATAMDLSVLSALRLMALSSLLAYIVPALLALIVLRRSRARWLFLGLALLPPALLQTATITADALTNGVALLFAALLVKASLEHKRLGAVETGLLYASIVLLPICKPSYLFLIPLALLVRSRLRSGPRPLLWIAMAVSTAIWVVWTWITRGIGDVLAFYRADYESSEFGLAGTIAHTLADPLGFLGNVARTIFYRDNFFFLDLLGSSNVRVPSTAMLAMIVALLVAAGWVNRIRVSRGVRWTWIAVGLLSVAALFGTLYATFTPIGFYLLDGVQGRYFFPLWPILIMGILCFFPLRWKRIAQGERVVGTLVVVVATASVALTVAKYWYVVWVGA